MKTKTILLQTTTLILCAAVAGCVATRERPTTEPMPPMEKAEVQMPREEPSKTQAMIQNLGGKVLFDFNSAELKPEARDALAQIGTMLKEHPQEKIRIDGFTDSIGSPNYNEELSLQRAETVSNLLMAQGAAPTQLEAMGHGEKAPVASNDTDEGRAENRRVELSLETPSAG